MESLPRTIYWRVDERNTPHQTYCARQAAWRGPFLSPQQAAADAVSQGYQASLFRCEVVFWDGTSPEPPAPTSSTLSEGPTE